MAGNLPDGVTQRMIDEALQSQPECAYCGAPEGILCYKNCECQYCTMDRDLADDDLQDVKETKRNVTDTKPLPPRIEDDQDVPF